MMLFSAGEEVFAMRIAVPAEAAYLRVALRLDMQQPAADKLDSGQRVRFCLIITTGFPADASDENHLAACMRHQPVAFRGMRLM